MNRKLSHSVCFLALLLAGMAASVVRAQALQPLDDLRHTAEVALTQHLRSAGGGAGISATAGTFDSRLRLPHCATPLEGVVPTSLQPTARMTVGVRCSRPTWNVYVPLLVESELTVLVLREAAARNSVLTENDVVLQQRRVPGVAAGYLTDVQQLRGRHLRLPASSGTPLTADLLRADLLVKRGQRVTLVANLGGIEVRALGEAIGDASAAGRVRVLNLSSRKIVEGQAESGDRVRVSL